MNTKKYFLIGLLLLCLPAQGWAQSAATPAPRNATGAFDFSNFKLIHPNGPVPTSCQAKAEVWIDPAGTPLICNDTGNGWTTVGASAPQTWQQTVTQGRTVTDADSHANALQVGNRSEERRVG